MNTVLDVQSFLGGGDAVNMIKHRLELNTK